MKNIVNILGGIRRDLENNRSIYLYPRIYNILIAVGPTDDETGHDNDW